MPDLIGLTPAEATRALKTAGLRVSPSAVRSATCAGHGVIVRQRPRAGTVTEPRKRVIALADRLDCGPLQRRSRVDDTGTRLVDAFVSFARGERPAPQVSDRVRFYLGGAPAGELAIADVEDRKAWRMCPRWKVYAAGICPFTVLTVPMYNAVNGHSLVYSYERREGACLIESAQADLSAVQHLRRLVVMPALRFASCASGSSIELYYDGERLAAVNLTLSEP